MSKISETNEQWKAFARDRSQAQLEMSVRHKDLEKQIEALRERIQRERAEFAREWDEIKQERQHERDEAIKAAWREGWSGPEILRAMNSNHTKLVYRLRDDVLAEGAVLTEAQVPTMEADEAIEGLMWESHPHIDTHGWLVSQDRTYYKHWSTPNTYYIADRQGHFIAGSREAFDKADHERDTERVNELVSLLDGTFEGQIRLGVNHFTR